jgi:hypothetical protein
MKILFRSCLGHSYSLQGTNQTHVSHKRPSLSRSNGERLKILTTKSWIINQKVGFKLLVDQMFTDQWCDYKLMICIEDVGDDDG